MNSVLDTHTIVVSHREGEPNQRERGLQSASMLEQWGDWDGSRSAFSLKLPGFDVTCCGLNDGQIS